ncbi:MAG: DUF4105 domain-containing protein [Muribaculaceae bacterium]|nr:DUF4105 domain-containing protein [Muribaculaceae bacterium]
MKKLILMLMLAVACVAAGEVPRISLLTALPGAEIYELEGHTSLRVRSAESDIVVNWGVFDFNSPNFVYRFVKGETDYLCAAYPTELFFEDYRRQGRAVVEQPLLLDSVETVRLIGLLEENLRPENRVYRYNYVKDNCATRPLLMIEQAVGKQLIASEEDWTCFRNEMRRYHRDYPWYQFGIDMALGRGIDKKIGSREAAFAPVSLMQSLELSPMVGESTIIGEQTLKHKKTPWVLTPLAIGLLVLLLACVVKGRVAKVYDTLMFTAYGLAGCVLFFLFAVSTHEATSPNLLLLWLNPLCLLGAVLPWIKSAKRVKVCYFFLNFALIILLAILAPILGRQMNPAFWMFMAADGVRSLANARHICLKENRS